MSETQPELIERMKLRDKLIKALESGKYEQCKGAYRKGIKVCFIGLAYHLISKNEEDYLAINGTEEEALKKTYGFKDIGLMIDLNDGNFTSRVSRLRKALSWTCFPLNGFSFPELAKLLKEKPHMFYEG